MICPFCSHENTRVLESRLSCEKSSIRRRRECDDCHRRFTTYERVENSSIMVIKKDKTKEKFCREKLVKSIADACKKNHVNSIMINKIAECVESEILMNAKKEVNSSFIGEKVLHYLKDINEVAHLRYLSAFRQYTNIEKLLEELRTSPKIPALF